MRVPNLNALRAFDASARHLSFRGAADELHVTQGAVAQQIRRLEADLGVVLFLRHARGLEMTSEGAVYAKEIGAAMRTISDATRNLFPQEKTLTISAPPSFATKWLMPRINDLSTALPGLQVNVIADEKRVAIRKAQVDLAIRQGAARQETGVTEELLCDLDPVVVCRAEDTFDERAFQKIEDFASTDLIEDSHRHWAHFLGQVGQKPLKPVMLVNQTALAMDAAAAGQGFAIIPAIFLRGANLKVIFRIGKPAPSSFYIRWSQTDARQVADLVTWLKNVVAKV